MVNDKLLGPDGRMYSISQLDRMSMQKVFDMLIDMGVSDNGQYRDFINLSRPQKRKRSTSRSRSRSIPRSRTIVYYKPIPKKPKTRFVVIYKAKRGSTPTQPSYQTDCSSKGYYSCTSSDKICKWNASRGACERK